MFKNSIMLGLPIFVRVQDWLKEKFLRLVYFAGMYKKANPHLWVYMLY